MNALTPLPFSKPAYSADKRNEVRNSFWSSFTSKRVALRLLLSTALLPICSAASLAQGGGYSYSWGDARVVNSNQSGLVHPSGSYIGPGTVSQSARGVYGTGAQTNPGLPRVNLGANVATPGDNMYGQNPTRVNGGGQMQGGGSNPGLPAARLGANVGTAGDAMRSDLNGPAQVRKEVFRPRYITQPMLQQDAQSQQLPAPRMAPGGVATYDDVPIKQGIHY